MSKYWQIYQETSDMVQKGMSAQKYLKQIWPSGLSLTPVIQSIWLLFNIQRERDVDRRNNSLQ